jgi:sugar lactone lactonase YvrE
VVASKDVTALGTPLTFDHLKHGATYVVKATAYKSGVKLLANQISDDAASAATITVGNDDRPLLASVPVGLVAKDFDGVAQTPASSPLDILPGGFATPSPGVGVALGGLQLLPLAGSGLVGLQLGPTDGARFNRPAGMCLDGSGGLLVADRDNNRIVRVDLASGTTSLFAGSASGVPGSANEASGDATLAAFNHPEGIARFGADSFLVADTLNATIRLIAPNPGGGWDVSLYAGSTFQENNVDTTSDLTGEARFGNPSRLAVFGTDVYVTDRENHNIRKISGTSVSVVAGATDAYGGALELPPPSGGFADSDMYGNPAAFNDPQGLAIDGTGKIYVADAGNHAIRVIDTALPPSDPGYVRTLAGMFPGDGPAPGYVDGVGSDARFDLPIDVAIRGGELVIADAGNHVLRAMDLTTHAVRTFAGGVHGDADGYARSARFDFPVGLLFDGSALLYVNANNRIRKFQ